MYDKFKIIDNNEIICPYCKNCNDDIPYERVEDDGIIKCYECNKNFNWVRDVTIRYITEANCEDNNEEHDFSNENDKSDWQINDNNNNEEFRICDCSKCNTYIVERRKI